MYVYECMYIFNTLGQLSTNFRWQADEQNKRHKFTIY